MKNAILMVVAMGMFGGALADEISQSTTVKQPVNATVANVCTYNPDSSDNTMSPPVSPEQADPQPYNKTDVNGLTYTQPGSTDLGTYKANGTAMGSAQTYIFRCTVGTTWNAPTGKTTIELTNGSSTLKVEADRKDVLTADDGKGSGEIHTGSASFSVPTGQYSAKAGLYSGKLILEITYF